MSSLFAGHPQALPDGRGLGAGRWGQVVPPQPPDATAEGGGRAWGQTLEAFGAD